MLTALPLLVGLASPAQAAEVPSPAVTPPAAADLELRRLRTAHTLHETAGGLLVGGPLLVGLSTLVVFAGIRQDRSGLTYVGLGGAAAGLLATVSALPLVFGAGSMARGVARRAHRIEVPTALAWVSGGLIVGSVVVTLAMGNNREWAYLVPISMVTAGTIGGFVWTQQCLDAGSGRGRFAASPALFRQRGQPTAVGLVVTGTF